MNPSLAHDVIAYAERCAGHPWSEESPEQTHACWQSRCLVEYPGPSPAIDALFLKKNTIRPNTIFVSLEDSERVIALRVLLADSGVSIRQLRSGFEDVHFPPFTVAVSSFARSSLHIVRGNPESWPCAVIKSIEGERPVLVIVEGLQFGRGTERSLAFASSSEVIHCAAANHSRLLLFD